VTRKAVDEVILAAVCLVGNDDITPVGKHRMLIASFFR
jgi:hypothetical protein